MLRILTTLILILAVFTSQAQVLIESLPVPAVGDSTVRYINFNVDIDVSDTGENASWTWTLMDTLATVTHFLENDATTTFPMANRKVGGPVFSQYLSMTETNWFQVGGSGVDPIGFGISVQTIVEPGLTDLYAPISYGDTIVQSADSYTGIPLVFIPDSILQLLPVVPDTIRVVVGLDRTDIVDAYGTLMLNGEPYTVARMVRTEMYDARVQAKVSILPWVDVTDLLLGLLPPGIALKDTTYSQRYIADGVGYPLATVILNADGTSRNSEHSTDVLSAVSEVHLQEVGISPNPSGGAVTIAFDNDQSYSYLASVSTISGETLTRFPLQDGQTRRDLSFLTPGVYILTVYDNTGRISALGKIIMTGR